MGVAGPRDGELQPPAGRQAVVAELGTQALETDDLDALFRMACERVTNVLDTEYAKVLELLPGGQEVFLRAGVGWQDGIVGSATVPTDRESQAGYTLLSEEPVIVEDLQTEERFSGPELLTTHDVVSGISVIIGSVDNPWGVLGTHSTEHHEFTAADASFVQSVANILASAIENQRTQEALREEKEEFRRLVEQVEDYAIFRVDTRGHVQSWNKGAAEITGYERDEIIGRHVSELHPDDDADGALADQLMMDAEATGQREYEGHLVRKDGSRFWASMSITALYDPDDELRGFTAVTKDLSERKSREAALERATNLLNHAERTADVGGWEIDPETRTVSYTRHLRNLLEIPEGESRHLDDAIAMYHEDDQDRIATAIEQALESGDPIDLEVRRRTPSGTLRWLHVQGVPEQEDGRIERVRGAAQDITDRKRSEAELDRTFDLLRHTERIADVGGWEIDTQTEEVFWTDQIYELLGLSKEKGEPPLEEAIELYHPEDQEIVAGAIEEAIETGKPFDIEARIRTSDRGVRWLHLQGDPETEDDEVACLRGAAQDVTERKAREQELQRDSAIIDALGDPVYALDAEGNVTFVNDAMTEWSGYEEDELLGSHVSIGLSEEDIAQVESVIANLLSEDPKETAHVEFEAYTRDGERRLVENHISLLLDEEGEFAGSAGGIRDITDRKRRERELAQYRALTEAANDVIVTIDGTSTIQTVNPAVADVFGYDPEELVGEPLTRLMPDDLASQHRDAVERYLETGDRTVDWDYLELPGQHADGEEIPLAISFSEVEFEGERFFTGVIRDITQRKEYERELEESHERLEQFATAVSHDLREPLGAVSSYLQLLERRYEDELDEDAEEFIQFAVGGATRMREMIDGLVTAYGRVESEGEPFQPVDLDAVVENVRRDMQGKIEENQADIDVGDLPEVEADETQLYQLFLNLIDNAIKYSGDAPPDIDIRAERADEEWVISVSDEGIGIDPAAADAVFDVFHRLHDDESYPGTGIGLALCERIVERHGGEIWVDSAPGEGATFSFTLPLEQSIE